MLIECFWGLTVPRVTRSWECSQLWSCGCDMVAWTSHMAFVGSARVILQQALAWSDMSSLVPARRTLAATDMTGHSHASPFASDPNELTWYSCQLCMEHNSSRGAWGGGPCASHPSATATSRLTHLIPVITTRMADTAMVKETDAAFCDKDLDGDPQRSTANARCRLCFVHERRPQLRSVR